MQIPPGKRNQFQRRNVALQQQKSKSKLQVHKGTLHKK